MRLDWVNNFTSAQSDGTLPLDSTAGAMRYKRAIIWEVDLFGFGIGSKIKKASWVVQIESPDGSLLFFQEVEMELMLISLSVPGLSLFTWNIVKDNASTDATDIIDGKELGEGEIKKYLLGGLLQSNMIPASGQSSTNFTATIITDWYSPGYLFPGGIPAGSKVKIKTDVWDLGPASVEYSWAFGSGGTILDTLIAPETGQTFLLHLDDGDLKLARTRRGQPTLELRKVADPDAPADDTPEGRERAALRCDYEASLAPTKLDPSFTRLYRKDGALYSVCLANRLRLFRSHSDGKDWKELEIMPVETTTATRLNITLQACAFDREGSTLYLYGSTTQDDKENKLKSGRPMFVELKNEGNNWKVSARGEVKDGDQPPKPERPVDEPPPSGGDNTDDGDDDDENSEEGEEEPEEEETVNNLPANNIAGLEWIDGRLYLVAKTSENGMGLYVSSDGLRSLKAVKIS